MYNNKTDLIHIITISVFIPKMGTVVQIISIYALSQVIYLGRLTP